MPESFARRPLLETRDLVVEFETPQGPVRALDGVSLSVYEGEALGLVGESGCGKTVLAMALLNLVPAPGRIVSGEILWRGENLLTWPEKRLRRLRGAEMALVFQEPMTALNPVFTVGNQIAETIVVHQGTSWKQAMSEAVDLLRLVAVPEPERRVHDYPHQMSGGLRQRVLLAMALSCNPALLIADEPTTALDVTIQAQILELLDRLRRERGLAVLLISHDLGVVAETADRVAVMYTGRIVEVAPATALYHSPMHPYTVGLLASRPLVGQGGGGRPRRRLPAIRGMVPDLGSMPVGCDFAPRCPDVFDDCHAADPPLFPVGAGHQAACEKYRTDGGRGEQPDRAEPFSEVEGPRAGL